MLKNIKNLLARNALILAVALTVLITLLSLLSISEYVPDLKISYQDKLEHFIAYFVLGLSWFLVNKRYLKTSKYLVACCVVIYGIIIEILQDTITNYRSFDYYDIVANTFGVLVAFYVFDKIIIQFKNK